METKKRVAQDVNISNNNELITSNNQQHSFLRRFGKKGLLYSGATALVGFYGVPAAFGWLGFSATGVTTGSLAASWQSTHLAPGIFAFMQSTAATGSAKVGVASVGLGAAWTKAFYDTKKDGNKQKINADEKIRSKL